MLNGPDYEGAIARRWRTNVRKVATYLRAPSKVPGKASKELNQKRKNLHKRIATYVKRFGFKKEEVVRKIKKDEMFRANFAIDPRKQNIDEETALAWLKKQPLVNGAVKLPASGDDALFVSNDGDIREGRTFKVSTRPSKSLDFRWTTGETTFFAMHKRTTSSGGSQGTTKTEVLRVLQNFLKCEIKGIALLVILDGDFWTDAQLEKMREQVRRSSPRSYALPITEVPMILKRYRPKKRTRKGT